MPGFSDEALIEGRVVGDRDQERLEQRLRTAMRSGLPELARTNLKFGRHAVEDETSGDLYRIVRGEVDDPRYTSAVAFFINANGDAAYLERPTSGPKTRAELDARQAEREQRRTQPRPRPQRQVKR
jgi:hypothetical protein